LHFILGLFFLKIGKKIRLTNDASRNKKAGLAVISMANNSTRHRGNPVFFFVWLLGAAAKAEPRFLIKRLINPLYFQIRLFLLFQN